MNRGLTSLVNVDFSYTNGWVPLSFAWVRFNCFGVLKMPFVRKDADGKILAVYEQLPEGAEEIAPDDPALISFINKNVPSVHVTNEWAESDLALTRVVEDLIDVLIEKHVIIFTDLPDIAQEKVMERRRLRNEFSYVESLFQDDENGFDESDDVV